jgi:hypothetical protein
VDHHYGTEVVLAHSNASLQSSYYCTRKSVLNREHVPHKAEEREKAQNDRYRNMGHTWNTFRSLLYYEPVLKCRSRSHLEPLLEDGLDNHTVLGLTTLGDLPCTTYCTNAEISVIASKKTLPKNQTEISRLFTSMVHTKKSSPGISCITLSFTSLACSFLRSSLCFQHTLLELLTNGTIGNAFNYSEWERGEDHHSC